MSHNRLSAKAMMLTYRSAFYVSFMLLAIAVASCKKTHQATPDPVKTRAQIVAAMTEGEQNALIARKIETVKKLPLNTLGEKPNPETVGTSFTSTRSYEKAFATSDVILVDSLAFDITAPRTDPSTSLSLSPIVRKTSNGQRPLFYYMFKETINGADYYRIIKGVTPAAATDPNVDVLTTSLIPMVGKRFAVMK